MPRIEAECDCDWRRGEEKRCDWLVYCLVSVSILSNGGALYLASYSVGSSGLIGYFFDLQVCSNLFLSYFLVVKF